MADFDSILDPMERLVFCALAEAGVRFMHESGGQSPVGLDFYLPDYDVHVEVKRFHSERIAAQMARADNVIALQGEKAVRLFCDRLVGAVG